MRRGKLLFTIKEIQEPIYDAFDEFTGNYKKAYSNFNKLKQEQASKNPEGLWETDQKPEDPGSAARSDTSS